ncbi:MAG TPA: hypothetical protein VN026_12025, partial [Bacteroidia bacterium]|nr:hypothetical protein [Bacteroidia bacterium]
KEIPAPNIFPPKIIWIEIPASNLARAVRFYETVFNSKLKKNLIDDKNIAVFDEKETGIKGCIIETKGLRASGGIKPTFFVNVMCDAISLIEANGGCVINHPVLLKQKNEKGEILIGGNLIDRQVGYICEITDSEGNGLFLYSHS